MRTVRLFVSSPNDVAPERQRVQWIAERLNGEFEQVLRIETILWETSVYNAHGSFQDQIDNRAKPGDCDIVLAIFWGRLGSALSEHFPPKMPDGSPYPSGTAYEVLSALEARKANGNRPDVFVFRKTEPPSVLITDKAARDEADRQWSLLGDFFARHFADSDNRILRAVEPFRERIEFEKKVELLLRQWIKSNVSQGAIWSIEEKGSPFRGLEPFDAKHADVYFGRDRKIRRAIDELKMAAERGKPFLLIPGASGSGKSSLMRAGLAPRLVRPGTVSGVDLWRVAVMRPATDGNPLLALARALFVTGDERKDDPGGFGMALPELAQGDFTTPEPVAQLFKGAAEVAVAPIVAALDRIGKAETLRRGFERPLRVNLLLLVDQFEEIFAESVSAEERTRFANLLAALVNTQRVWLIASLRGDMYLRMITERPFGALKDTCGQFDLGPPGADELDEIVHRSAEAAGLQYEERVVKDEAGNERRERLDDRLLEDAKGENTLPLLQFAFNLLFEKCWVGQQSKVLTLAAYEEFGGLDGAINQTAEIALARLVRPGVNVRFPLEKDIQDEIARTINPRLEALLQKLVGPIGQERQQAEASAEGAPTARIVPMAEARRDGATGELIEALLQARILLATKSGQVSCLRIAHDRVITSWQRAWVIIQKNRDFYRIRDSIEHERQRWEESDRSVAFLIPAGAQITLAEEALRQFGNAFDPATRDFVTLSSRRASLRQRLMTAATLLFALVAVLATAASYYATQQRRKATENYVAARETVGRLVTSIAQKLRDREGIRRETIEEALNQVVELVDILETQNQGDSELKRIHASMHFEFAKVFQNARILPRALEQAEKGLQIRTDLAARPSVRREWLSDQALSLDQVGDIHREMAKTYGFRDPRAPGEFAASRQRFDQAHEIRLRLHGEEQDNPAWAFGLSQSLVRIGDHKEMPDNDKAGALADYRKALELIIDVVRREPEKEDSLHERALHELGWCFKKVGDILFYDNDLTACLDTHEKGLCTRRYLAYKYPLNTLYKRDVAFSLERIGKAKSKKKDHDGAKKALFEALQLRQELIDQDSSQKLWLIEYAEALHQIGLCMQETREFELAGGFFETAVEKLKAVSEDARAKDKIKKASADRQKAIGLLSTEEQAKLIKQSATKILEMAGQRKAQPIESESTWNELKATLLQSAVAQQR